jgi:hypothetical protein
VKRKNGGRHNAFKHGAYAHDLVLPGESWEDLEDLCQGLIDEWNPAGPLETDAVLSLAKCMMGKRRLDNFYKKEAQFAVDHPHKLKLIYIDRVRRLLHRVKTFEQATEIIELLPLDMRTELKKHVPEARFGNNAEAWIENVLLHMKSLIQGMDMAQLYDEDSTLFQAEQAAKLRELTEKKIALDDRVDAQIDRAFKRLVQLKTYKDVVRLKELEANVNEHNQKGM